jgi:hypothetical protein
MKKYAFYDSGNIVRQTFVADIDAQTLEVFMSDYAKLFNTVGVQEYDENDDIQIGWSVITHQPVGEVTE